MLAPNGVEVVTLPADVEPNAAGVVAVVAALAVPKLKDGAAPVALMAAVVLAMPNPPALGAVVVGAVPKEKPVELATDWPEAGLGTIPPSVKLVVAAAAEARVDGTLVPRDTLGLMPDNNPMDGAAAVAAVLLKE